MPHRIEQPTQKRLSIKLSGRGDDDPDGLKFKYLPIDHRHAEHMTMT